MWSKIPNLRGLRAANNWLRDIAPERQVRVRRTYDQSIGKIERALAGDASLPQTFRMVVEHAQFFGRVEGLREGLDLYEYGTRIQNDNTAAFQTILNYIARCAGRCKTEAAFDEAISAESVCVYLDREIRRTKQQITSSIKIKPPEPWGCDTWQDALKKKKNSVQSLVSKAKKEAISDKYCTLMAWKTWCMENRSKALGGKKSASSTVQTADAAASLFD
jgi:hypothetical protein